MTNTSDAVEENQTASENANETIDESPDGINNDETDEDVEIIYKKERNPIVKFFLGFLVFLVIAYIVLFTTGFIMGWLGIHPPTIDNSVFVNQWEKVTGEEQTTEPSSELETKEPSETTNNDTNNENSDETNSSKTANNLSNNHSINSESEE